MYAVTSMPPDSRTRATLRSAEFGFFGVVVYTRVHTPRRCGDPFRAGVLFFDTLSWRPLRTSWLMVGTWWFPFCFALSTRHGAGHGGQPTQDQRPPRAEDLADPADERRAQRRTADEDHHVERHHPAADVRG